MGEAFLSLGKGFQSTRRNHATLGTVSACFSVHFRHNSMPQLDTLTFFTQIFWVFVMFSVFYAICLKHILPGISRILKIRKKKLEFNKNAMDSFVDEERQTAS